MLRHAPTLASLLAVSLLAAPPSSAQRVEGPLRFGDPPDPKAEPFFPGTTYADAIPTPDALLGQRHGSRLAHHDEIVGAFERWAALSDRMTLERYATSHEGRALVRAVVSSPANLARLETLLGHLEVLADPRGHDEARLEAALEEALPVAWLGYSIHGDELSGADASMAVAYHLVAGTSADVTDLLERLVVVVDPVMNPDGRERIVAQIEQMTGYTPNLDLATMQRGWWPYGRGNHYLFDLNRDWMSGVHPETRGRWAQILRLRPQLLVDAHEMGITDTYLFYPQAAPHNPSLPATLDRWHRVFAHDQAAAFDRRGWAYYTREWADAWAPFYSDAWGSLNGAVGILYEQAGISGFPVRRPAGDVLTYRDAVHHQAVSSLANLGTLAARADEVLADYAAHRRRAVAPSASGAERLLVVRPGAHPAREAALLATLRGQDIEVARADAAFTAREAVDGLGRRRDEVVVDAGAWLVTTRQPQRALVESFLAFDVRVPEDALREERTELERHARSKMYDVTAWSLPLTHDLDALWCLADEVGTAPLPAPDERAGLAPAPGDGTPVAWVVDGTDDRSVRFASEAMDLGLAVFASDRGFATGGRRFARGSLLVRAIENAPDAAERVARAAAAAGVLAHPTTSGRSPDEGPDLGGGHFARLERPRVGLLSNAPVAPDTFGHAWFLLDALYGVTTTIVDVAALPTYDLRRYNVLVVPPTWGEAGAVLRPHAEALASWVEAGGTLVLLGDAAAAAADEELGLSRVRRRADVLGELDAFAFAAAKERAARDVTVDVDRVWGEVPASAPSGAQDEDDGQGAAPDDVEEAERRDRWMRRFAPRGAIARGLVDDEHWITVGCRADELAVMVDGAHVLLSRAPVHTPVRLAPEDELRLAGLLWPEARRRLADSAWLTVERKGRGQLVLFAAMPGYRGQWPSTGRLLANAVVYGPGLGADPPLAR